jgi:hypothetical protein
MRTPGLAAPSCPSPFEAGGRRASFFPRPLDGGGSGWGWGYCTDGSRGTPLPNPYRVDTSFCGLDWSVLQYVAPSRRPRRARELLAPLPSGAFAIHPAALYPFSSWPGLARPSTSLALPKKGVDTRDSASGRPGHDEVDGPHTASMCQVGLSKTPTKGAIHGQA